MLTKRHSSSAIPLLVLVAAMTGACADHPTPTPQRAGTPEAEEIPAEGQTHHAIDYIEIAVLDMAESKRFYEAAFDWQFNDYGPGYAGIRKGDGEAGGLSLGAEVTTGGPLVILYSENLDMTLRRVTEAGGRIVKEPFEFPGGRRFHFLDPSGNELAVWSEH